MPAGLLQIATNGASDVYLMGVPEMTFFKTVYHRYVNFSIETKELYFDDTPDFGNTVSCTISSLIGDLVYRILLVIDLPEVILLRSTNETLINNALAELNTAKDDYNNFNTYANYVFDAYNIIQTGLAPDNSDPNDIYTQVNYYFNAIIDVDQYNAIVGTLPSQITTNSDILTIISNINSNVALTSDQKLTEMADKTDSISVYLTSINKYYFDTYIEKLNIYNDLTNQRYNFAWIERLGHYIFDYIDLEIGGNRIDRQYNHWVNIWYELTGNVNLVDTYNKMIGNITLLNGYNRYVKPEYRLYIPLNFFFNKNNGLALPIFTIKQDVNIIVKFTDLYNCIITDYDKLDTSDLRDVISIKNATLYADYIYLDRTERKKFAQFPHEYLIEQTQFVQFDNLVNKENTLQCDFNYPCKELIWVAKPTFSINQLDLTTNPYWYKYDYNNNNTVESAYLTLNVYNRIERQDGLFFNYLQPYESHTNAPDPGVNVLSFCLHPELHQPSGSCNMSKIKFQGLTVAVTDEFKNSVSTYSIMVYTQNYNILRIYGGYSSIVFLF